MKQAITLAFLLNVIIPSAFAQTFRTDDPVWVDNDTAVDVQSIAKHKLNDHYDFLIHTFGKPGDRTQQPALNINTLGEVPDSSWFQNRHGKTRMSVEDLVRGPNTGSGPSMDGPWFVVGAKTEGITPGFRIRDSRGDVYFIKFDPPQNPEMATAAEVISTKFFHAMGYNVPENYLAFFTRQQLRADPKATITDATGRERQLEDADLDMILASVNKFQGGRYRAVASKQLQGVPLGPFQYHGNRPDDPDGYLCRRASPRASRDARFRAWLNHDDSRAINSLDMLVGQPGRRHVRHYLIDFGSTLGSGSVSAQKPRAGWEYMWEPATTFKRIATLGLWDKKWIRVSYPNHPSIGRFESTWFEPQNWKPEYPNPAFLNATDDDTYWAAKIVMSFTSDEIRAIVKTGQLSDPVAEDYLVNTLMERRDKIGRYWLTRKNSVDNFTFEDGELRFKHLARSSISPDGRKPGRMVPFRCQTGISQPWKARTPPRPELFLVEVTSVEGKVKVYIGKSQRMSRDCRS